MIDPGMIRKLQSDLHTRIDKLHSELDDVLIEGSAGGGVVKVTVTGNREVRSIEIGSEAIDPDDPEMLQDLVVAAVNQALDKAKETYENRVSDVTGGLHFPGLF